MLFFLPLLAVTSLAGCGWIGYVIGRFGFMQPMRDRSLPMQVNISISGEQFSKAVSAIGKSESASTEIVH